MSDFIQVLGDDPHYTANKSYMYIDIRLICKVYPIYGVKGDNGDFWRCDEDHEDGVLVTYRLVDVSGDEYYCGKEQELRKLGIETDRPKPRIGFVNMEEKDRTAVDLIANSGI